MITAQKQLKIVIATDFADDTGARYRKDGPNSGQQFLEDLLRPKFLEAKSSGGILLVDLDGAWGYASSFLSGSFGALASEFGRDVVRKYIALKSDEDAIALKNVNHEIDTEGSRA
jgi:hypothetical protein